MTLRSQFVLSGGLGLAGGAVLTGGTLFLLWRMDLPPLITGLGVWLLLGLVLLFSVAEIPVMIFGMRQMVIASSGTQLAVLTNAAFTSFAAVYAAPFLLLTGQVGIGVGLASLGLVRFAGALVFVPGHEMPTSKSRPPASSNSQPTVHSEEL
jgi:hypothetical protein